MSDYDPNRPGGGAAPGYPPPPYQGPPPQQPKRKGGCMRMIGIATVAVVGLVIVISVIAIAASGGDDDESGDTSTGTTEAGGSTDEPESNSGNEENPPQADIELTECGAGIGNPGGGSFAGAAGTITNHSSEPSDYLFSVEFVTPDGTRYAESPGSANAVAPDQAVEWGAPTLEEFREGTECRVTQVERFAS